jgi:hypothetical protein
LNAEMPRATRETQPGNKSNDNKSILIVITIGIIAVACIIMLAAAFGAGGSVTTTGSCG